jgi:hypothetical protein
MVDNGTKPITPEIEEELDRILSSKVLPRRSGAKLFAVRGGAVSRLFHGPSPGAKFCLE